MTKKDKKQQYNWNTYRMHTLNKSLSYEILKSEILKKEETYYN